jgi:hypothetical protein
MKYGSCNWSGVAVVYPVISYDSLGALPRAKVRVWGGEGWGGGATSSNHINKEEYGVPFVIVSPIIASR